MIPSEKLVQQSIDDLQQSKSQTTIVIAHRLTTIKAFIIYNSSLLLITFYL
jgi:ABC-type multidrug transport system fused ATPase/permease subunit